MRNLIAAAGAMLWAMLASLPAFAQAGPPSEASRKAELSAAWQAASKAGTKGPSDITPHHGCPLTADVVPRRPDPACGDAVPAEPDACFHRHHRGPAIDEGVAV
jgi:hypothetical protein